MESRESAVEICIGVGLFRGVAGSNPAVPTEGRINSHKAHRPCGSSSLGLGSTRMHWLRSYAHQPLGESQSPQFRSCRFPSFHLIRPGSWRIWIEDGRVRRKLGPPRYAIRRSRSRPRISSRPSWCSIRNSTCSSRWLLLKPGDSKLCQKLLRYGPTPTHFADADF